MADNTTFQASLDPAMPKIADDEVSYSGDTNAHVQIIQLGVVSGAEGAHALTKMRDFSTGIGESADAAAGSDTGTASLVSLFKRLLSSKLPASLGVFGGLLTSGVNAVLTASVAAGATLQATGSDLGGLRTWGIVVPSNFDGTQIQFQTSDSLGGTYVPVYDITNTRVVMTVAVSRYYDIPGELMALRFVKIECVTAQVTDATNFLIIGKS